MRFSFRRLVFLVLCAGTELRASQGAVTEGQEVLHRNLEHLRLPKDAKVLLHAQTTCRTPPVELRAAFALRCGMTSKCRECMGVSGLVPIYASRGCQGKECIMKLSPGPPTCMLTASSVEYDARNVTRKATCGINEEDSFLLAPCDSTPGMPTSSTGQCIYGLPLGVSLRTWFPCSNGVLENVIGLRFQEEPTEGVYMCIANPTCVDKSYSSEIVCFTSEEEYALPLESSAVGEAKTPCIVLRLILCFMLLKYSLT